MQLKTTQLVSSDDETPPINQFKRRIRKKRVLDLYIENLRSKRLQKNDVRLLQHMGL